MSRALCVLLLALAVLGAGCTGTVAPPTDAGQPTLEPTPLTDTPQPTIAGATPTGAPAPSAVSSPGALEADLIEPGRLVICSAFPRLRYAEYDASGQPFGIDVEIGLAIAERLGLEGELREVPFEQLIDAVAGGTCDIAISGHFITRERLAVIDLVPYREGSVNVVVRAGNPLGISDLDDLCGRTMAVVGGTIYVDIVRGAGEYVGQGIDDTCQAAGAAPVSLSEHVTEADAVNAFAAGEADAFVGNEAVAVERPAEFELSDAELPRLRNGIGHRKGGSALDEALRQALRAMIDDGTYSAIIERYGATGIELTELP